MRKRLTPEQRQAVYNKMRGHCSYCGCDLEYKAMQVDHVVPLKRGGADELENMLPSCRSCNHYKHTMSVDEFRKMVQRMPDVLTRDSVTYKNAVRFGLVVPNPKKVTFYFELV